MNAEDTLYLLHTSGSTAKPKGVLHTTGGYLVHASVTHKWIFDIHDDTVWWCAADIGWVTGHSYIVYGPLNNGTTSVLYEGDPAYPDWDRHWEIVERYRRQLLLHRADAHPLVREDGRGLSARGTTCRRCACSARSASRSTRRPGSGTGR